MASDFEKFDEFVRATDPGVRSDLGFLAETPRVEELIARGLRENLARSDWYQFQT